MKKATRLAYGETLVELGGINENIVVLDGDLSKSTMTHLFGEAYPERFFNMGIAEQNLYGTAAGLATTGKVVFASTFAMFATGRAYEIIRNAIVYTSLNVKICASHAGLTVGEDGGSHQAIEDLALMRVLPGMIVINPCDEITTRKAVFQIAKMEGPTYLRLGRLAVDPVYNETVDFQIGKGIVLTEGNDITLMATGLMVQEAVKAEKLLREAGIQVRLVDMHTIKPIDKDLIIKCAKETKGIITIEEHSVIGGLGSAVSEVLSQNCPTKMKIMGVQDKFGESGKPMELLEKHGLTETHIVNEVIEFLK